MNALTIFYDPQCGLCTAARRWLEGQPTYVAPWFVGYNDPRAREILPEIDQLRPAEEIVVLADDGAIYQGADAWIICLWATVTYRPLSLRLAVPALRPLAARICQEVSRRRYAWSARLHLRSDEEIARALPAEEPCETGCRLPQP